jgi:hypothetical protein
MVKKGISGNDSPLTTKLLAQIYLIAAMMVLAWITFVAVAVFKHDLLVTDPGPSDGKREAYLWLALAMDAAGPLLIWRVRRRFKRLASAGVRGIATIVKISSASNHGLRPVTYSFQAGALTYTVKRDTPEVLLRPFLQSHQVPVIYDPANPKSCELIFSDKPVPAREPASSPPASVRRSIFSRGLPKPLLFLAALGSWFLAAVVVRALGADAQSYSATILVIGMLVTVAVELGWMLIGDWVIGRPDALIVRTRLWEWVALFGLLIALPVTIIWTRSDQAAAVEAQRKHDEEDRQNAEMMKAATVHFPATTSPTAP